MTVTQQKIWSKTADQACENSLSPYLVTGSELQILDVLTTAQNHTHTHTHTRLTALFPGLPGSAGTRKVKPIWTLLKQETESGSGISWAICTLLQTDNHASTSPLGFLKAGCPSCRPTNSVNALKAKFTMTTTAISTGWAKNEATKSWPWFFEILTDLQFFHWKIPW